MVAIRSCWSADMAQGERVLQPLRSFGKPLFDRIGPMPYVTLQSSSDESNAAGRRFYAKSGFFIELQMQDIDTLIEAFEMSAEIGVSVILQQGGGAISRVRMDSAAFPNRRAHYWAMVAKGWTDPLLDETHVATVRRAWKHIEPRTEGFYVNAMADEEYKRVAANYGSNYPKLAQLKRKYDPTNLFRLNANVLPA